LIRVDFDRPRGRLEFRGAQNQFRTGGFLLGDAAEPSMNALGLSGLASEALCDNRTGKKHASIASTGLFRQSSVSGGAGPDTRTATNATVFALDPVMRQVVGGPAVDGAAGLGITEWGRFETETLALAE